MAENDIASLSLRVDALEIDKASESMRRMQKTGTDTESSLSGSTSAITAGFQKVAAQAAILYGAFQTIGGASREFLGFDKSIALISTQLGNATEQTKEFESASKRLALQFGTNLTDQSGAFYEILSAGITDTTKATDVLTEANKLAIGGNARLSVTIDGLTSVMKGYGDKVKSVADVSDALFVAALAGKTTIEELSEGLGRAVPLAENLGVSFDELSGSVAALTLAGISTREAVTGIRAVLAAVIKPTSEAADEADRLGLQFNSAAVKSKGFAAFLEDIRQKTGGSSDSMALLFGGVESLIPVLALTGNAGVEFNKIMEQMAEKTGVAQASFEKMNASSQAKIDKFFASINNIAVTLGGTLSSILTPAAEAAAKALNRLFNTESVNAAEKQEQLITRLTAKLEHMKGLNSIIPIDNIFYNRKDFAEVESQLENAIEDLKKLQSVKEEIAKPAPGTSESALVPNNPPKKISGGDRKEVISESQRFIDALKTESREAGVTGIALLELKANYLGVSDTARPYIQALRDVEARLVFQKDLEASRNARRQEGVAITESLRTAEERYADTQQKLINLLEGGDISAETFFRGIEKAGKEMSDTLNKGNQGFDQLLFAVQGWGRQASDALVDFAVSGKGSFGDFAMSVVKDIARMYVQMQLITPLLQSLPGLNFGGGSSGSSSAAANVFSGLFKGGRASGGSVSSNSLYKVNEQGPELFMTNGQQYLMTGMGSGSIVPLSKSSSGSGGMGVVVNLIEAPGKGGEVQQRQTANGLEIDVMVDQMVAKKTQERGSASNKGLRQNFGLTDNLVMR